MDYQIKQYSLQQGALEIQYIEEFFTTPTTLKVLKNTVIISLYKLAVGFPAPILFALMINEIGQEGYKRVCQTISYLPHFISWVIIAILQKIPILRSLVA